jgi:hypothetical protein
MIVIVVNAVIMGGRDVAKVREDSPLEGRTMGGPIGKAGEL